MKEILAVVGILLIAGVGYLILSRIDPLGGKDYSGVPPKAKVKIVVVVVGLAALLLVVKSIYG